ncbi:claudin-2 [Ambystoma mexicanum]|uniref:claudin-2 n=1 Tax=Ambystoma mexicanum TaxID=8296 RepID=UPI0037E98F58
MASVGLQLMGYILGMLGMLGTIIATLLPNWKNSSYIGTSIVTAVGFTKGLWMECAIMSTGITQCDIYNSMLALPADIQAAQALMITSSVVSILACIISVCGMKCTIFSQDSPGKDKIAVFGGVLFILGGLLGIIPIAWNLHVILQDFFNPTIPDPMKFEIGEALYLGIVSALLSVIGGSMLCASCPPKEPRKTYYSRYQAKSLVSKSLQPGISQSQKSKSDFNGYSQTGYV